MESRTTTSNMGISNENIINERLYQGSSQTNVIDKSPVQKKLAEEGDENFYNYLQWLGLANEPDFLVLPSSHHYYFEIEELKDVKAVVSMKPLNYIKQIKAFLHTIYHILPQKSYFIGSFIENQNQIRFLSGVQKPQDQSSGRVTHIEDGITSRIPFLKMMYNIMDSRTNRYLTKRTAALLLEDAGLKVLDMTELNGLTYYCVQKVKQSAE
jgi:hypothetical protein